MSYFRAFFKNKKITVMGLGLLGGVGDIRFLAEVGADLIVTDLKSKKELEPSLKVLQKYKDIKYTLGRHNINDFKNRDLIVRAPSTPLNSRYVEKARKNGTPVVMWAALFSKFAKEAGAKIIGITGTRGKTTTTALIVEILLSGGKKVITGGNVQGISILSRLPNLTPYSIIVLELDSWKLQGFDDLKISPNIAVFTNFMPDHLNYYQGSMKKYFRDKANIYKYQKKGDVLILGPGMKGKVKDVNSKIIYASTQNLPKSNLLGEHNLENVACAVEVAKVLKIPAKKVARALANFEGIEGRLQFIREINGVKYYNDTTATTPEATIAALRALGGKNKIILIAGGSDKGLNMSSLLKKIPEYCKAVILLSGTGTKSIRKKVLNAVEVGSMKEAVRAAREFSQSGDIVLLSPAFASFGMFNNEYERGDSFTKIVKGLR